MVDLVRLQDNVKKDAESYRDEFLAQQQRFDSKIKLLELQPDKPDEEFVTLVNFLSHTVPYYKESESSLFANRLFSFLEEKYPTLDRGTRKSVLQALILLRNRNRLAPLKLLSLCFLLFRVSDKDLRAMLYKYIVNDIQNVNRKQKSEKLNRSLQHKLYGVLEDRSNEAAAAKSLQVVIELYRREVWRDAKTVNVISTAVFSPNVKMMVAALRFLLGDALVSEGDGDSEDEYKEANQSVRELYQSMRIGKKTKSRQQKIKRAVSDVRKKGKKKSAKESGHTESSLILALNDPQGFTEKLFSLLKKSNHRFDVRLMMMNVISRCISVHELVIINFYPYVQRYLRPHQQDITNILTLLAQSCHEYIPGDVIQTLIRVLADNFVSDRSSSAAQTVGLNSIREICKRCPDVMDPDLLADLVQYKDMKDKGTSIAARALIRLFREENPKLLPKSFRGRPSSSSSTTTTVGGEEDGDSSEEEVNVDELQEYGQSRIEGISLLEKEQRKLRREKKREREEQRARNERKRERERGGKEEEEQEDEEEEREGEESGEEEEFMTLGDSDFEEGEESDEEEEGGEERGEESEEEEKGETLSFREDRRPGLEEEKEEVEEDQGDDEEEEEREGKKEKVPVEAMRALTQEEFERLRVLKMKKKLGDSIGVQDSDEEDDSDEGGFLDEGNIIGFQSHKRKSREERLQSVLAGREGREKFGSRKGKQTGGTTNLKKKKNQPFMLAKAGQQRKRKIDQKTRPKKKRKYGK